jgi:hypothetical protein
MKLCKRFLWLLALAMSAWPAAGQALATEWLPIGLQGTGVRSLARVPGRLCAGTEGKGVFCLDAGSLPLAWKPLGPDGTTITSLWIDSARSGLMFAAADAPPGMILLFRSTDGGQTWDSIGANIPPPTSGTHDLWLVHGVPGTPTVYAAGGAVWRSDDLGATWREVFPGDAFPPAFQSALEVAPTDPRTIWVAGDLAFTFAPQSYGAVSGDGGASWDAVWTSGPFDYVPVTDIAAHPRLDGLALIGLYGRVLRTMDRWNTSKTTLESPAYFFVDWGGAAGGLAFAAGSTNPPGGGAAYVSRDLGETWFPITGTRLPKLTIHDLAADRRLAGLAFAATNDGVYAFFGGGPPLCHDARRGVDSAVLWPGDCPPIMSPGPAIPGDVIVAEGAAVRAAPDHLDLGPVNCMIQDSDIAFATIDPPDPPLGEVFLILARGDGAVDYGTTSDGRPRLASGGDCR